MFISFIVPCFNGGKSIARCLTSILDLSGLDEVDYEIIVVDNNSNDQSIEIAQSISEKIIIITEKVQGRSNARNRGAKEAKGGTLCFIDVDVILSPNWLLQIRQDIEKHTSWGIVTSIVQKIKNDESWFQEFRIKAQGTVNSLNSLNELAPYVNTAAIAVNKQAFDETDGFDTSFDYFEDLDFGREVGLKQYTLVASEALVYCLYTRAPMTFLTRNFSIGFKHTAFIYKWSEDNKINCVIKSVKYYCRWVTFSLRNSKIGLLFVAYQAFSLSLAVIGAFASLFAFIKATRYPLNEQSWVKIKTHQQLVLLNLKTKKIKYLPF